MYERFTDRARESIRIGHEEAKRLNYPRVDTEHLLLGLFKCGGTATSLIFGELNIDVAKVLSELEQRMPPAPRRDDSERIARLPRTPCARRALKSAIEAGLKSNYVGTEHLLFGLIEQHAGMAPQVLMSVGLTIERVREQIDKIAGR